MVFPHPTPARAASPARAAIGVKMWGHSVTDVVLDPPQMHGKDVGFGGKHVISSGPVFATAKGILGVKQQVQVFQRFAEKETGHVVFQLPRANVSDGGVPALDFGAVDAGDHFLSRPQPGRGHALVSLTGVFVHRVSGFNQLWTQRPRVVATSRLFQFPILIIEMFRRVIQRLTHQMKRPQRFHGRFHFPHQHLQPGPKRLAKKRNKSTTSRNGSKRRRGYGQLYHP